ncbi:MAG: DUF4340 domain-containing protein [Treponema sp.]|jgi:hypothetical protein|nr:DUF4340 domain-containing protein [Treponema sp.]
MTKRTITIISALAVVILLIGGYFGAQAWVKAHPAISPWDWSDLPESPRLTEFDSSKLNRIENIGEGFALQKNANVWELVSANVPAGKIKIDQTLVSNKIWSLSSLWAESLIEEYPEDLSIYGLDHPFAHILIGDSDGKAVEIIFGNFTPSRSSYYVMLAESPAVYTLATYYSDTLLFSIDSVRNKDLFESLDPRAISHFILQPRLDDNPSGRTIDITPRKEDSYMLNSYTSFDLNSPYSTKLAVDSEKFGQVLEALAYLEIYEYIDDSPSSLAPYGLDRPGRVYIETPEETLDIFYGKSEFGMHYAKVAGNDSVFTLGGLENIINVAPFSLMDKFAMIHYIDHVDSFTVTGDGRTLTATIQGKGEDAIFYLNGRKTEDQAFRVFYQRVIGLLIDAEHSGPVTRGEGTDYIIEYKLNTPAVTIGIRLIPYNRDFYILEREGATEFRIARTQVRRIFEEADKMVYAE